MRSRLALLGLAATYACPDINLVYGKERMRSEIQNRPQNGEQIDNHGPRLGTAEGNQVPDRALCDSQLGVHIQC